MAITDKYTLNTLYMLPKRKSLAVKKLYKDEAVMRKVVNVINIADQITKRFFELGNTVFREEVITAAFFSGEENSR